jgi:carbon monoxide dehydrogenase subunit G
MHYTREIRTEADPRTALGFAANFLNLPIWDPSIGGVRKLTRGPLRAGTRFLVRFGFLGVTSDLTYDVVEYDPGKRAVLRSNTAWASATDTVTVEPTSRGSRLRWDAEIRLATLLTPFDPVVGAVFGPHVDRAVVGLEAGIDALVRWQARHSARRVAKRRSSNADRKAA